MHDSQNPLQPGIEPISATPVEPVPSVIPPVVEPKKSLPPILIAGLIVLLGGTLCLFVYNNLQKPTKSVTVVQAPPTPTPTPVRILSSIASQSAFIKFEASIASLSSQLNNYVVDDPSLSPPVLDLPLGYTR